MNHTYDGLQQTMLARHASYIQIGTSLKSMHAINSNCLQVMLLLVAISLTGAQTPADSPPPVGAPLPPSGTCEDLAFLGK